MLIKLFSWFWRKELIDYTGKKLIVVKICGPRSCIVETKGGSRRHLWFLIKVWKWYL